jgi:hypothetical protein
MHLPGKNRSETRRYIDCAGFVLVWMACGWFLNLGGTGYLLLGVPLIVIFQLLVARRPLHLLWVRDAKSFRLSPNVLLIALALLILPLLAFFFRVRHYGIMSLVIAIGTIPCSFALCHQSAARLRRALPIAGLAIAVGCAVFASFSAWDGRSPGFASENLPFFFTDIFCLTLAGFVVEEVVFRGAIDGYVAPAESSRHKELVSAIFVSFLWGIWHLPLADLYRSREISFLALAILLNILWGVPLSLCCRKSGTLLLPSVIHALCDAYRNVLPM